MIFLNIKNIYKSIFLDFYSKRKLTFFVFIAIVELSLFCFLNSEPDSISLSEYYTKSAGGIYHLFHQILIGNLFCSAVLIISGFFPFYAGTLFSTYLSFNFLIATGKVVFTEIPAKIAFLSLFPHAAFEIPAIILSVLISSFLST